MDKPTERVSEIDRPALILRPPSDPKVPVNVKSGVQPTLFIVIPKSYNLGSKISLIS